MALTPSQTESLLAIPDRVQLAQSVLALPVPLSLSDLRQIAEHAAALTPALQALRVGFVHSYTSDLLTPWLEVAGQLQGLQVEAYHAPYGQLLGEATADSGLVAHRPDITVLMLQRHDLHPALLAPIAAGQPEEAARILDEALGQARELVRAFRALQLGLLVVSVLPPLVGPALGLHDAQAERSERRFWDGFMARLGDWLREDVPSSLLLDLDGLMADVGKRRAMDTRHWLTARYPFSAEGSLELAMRLASIGRLVKTPRAKVLVLDADNTLWGGVIGEDGLEGIALGPDYPGNAYVAFQRRILELQQRGFILAMCSKNNEADVAEVLESHPHQILKAHHFVSWRVNWEPKPANLASLAEELNLGLDSFVFVDDSDHECAAVRARWPQVEVVQVPKRPQDVPSCLDRIARLEVLSITAEDRAKTALYQAERQRQEILGKAGDGDGGDGSHLHRLGMKMKLRLDARRNIPRLAQLTQKTNQFNLTTRRYDESQLATLVAADDWLVLDFSLADVYGDSGIVGLALAQLRPDGEAELDTFLMSCRVIGRCAEDAFMLGLLQQLQARGAHRVRARYLPTSKNALVKDLLPRLGFAPEDGPAGPAFLRDLYSAPPDLPENFPIRMEWAAEPAA
jgi:FkbH-like protein